MYSNPIDDHIRRLVDNEVARDASIGIANLNQMAEELEAAGNELGAMVKRGALSPLSIKPLMAKLPGVQLRHGRAVESLRSIKDKCEGAISPFFKDDRGPITREERARTVAVNAPLYARTLLAEGKLADQLVGKHKPTGMVVFNLGEGEDGKTWGWEDTSLDRYHTNLDKEGTLPTGFWFECFGVTVEVEALDGSEVVASDLRAINSGFMYWTEANEKVVIPLTHIGRAPALTHIRSETGADATQSVHTSGKPFIQQAPIFRLRSDDNKHGLLIKWPSANTTFSKSYVVTYRLEGAQGIAPGGLS